MLFDGNEWLPCSLVWLLAGLFSSFFTVDLWFDLRSIWYFNWMVLSLQREGTGFKNPDKKYLHSILWFKWCLPDSEDVEFVYFYLLLFSDIFHCPLAHIEGGSREARALHCLAGFPRKHVQSFWPNTKTGLVYRASLVSWFTLSDITPWYFKCIN